MLRLYLLAEHAACPRSADMLEKISAVLQADDILTYRDIVNNIVMEQKLTYFIARLVF